MPEFAVAWGIDEGKSGACGCVVFGAVAVCGGAGGEGKLAEGGLGGLAGVGGGGCAIGELGGHQWEDGHS